MRNDVSVSAGDGNKDLKIDILSHVRHLMPQARCSASVTIHPNQRGMSHLSHDSYFSANVSAELKKLSHLSRCGKVKFRQDCVSFRGISRHHFDFLCIPAD